MEKKVAPQVHNHIKSISLDLCASKTISYAIQMIMIAMNNELHQHIFRIYVWPEHVHDHRMARCIFILNSHDFERFLFMSKWNSMAARDVATLKSPCALIYNNENRKTLFWSLRHGSCSVRYINWYESVIGFDRNENKSHRCTLFWHSQLASNSAVHSPWNPGINGILCKGMTVAFKLQTIKRLIIEYKSRRNEPNKFIIISRMIWMPGRIYLAC